MHKEYWIAIGLYVIAVVLTALPFFGLVTIELDLAYGTLKFLHVVTVFLLVSILIGQLIAYHVMRHAKITTRAALEHLSLLDHVIPVGLVILGVLGHAMAKSFGPIWQVPWVYESAFALFAYTACGLAATLFFRRKRLNLEGGTDSPAVVYAASGIGVAFMLVISWIMIVKELPIVQTSAPFISITKHFAGRP